jgi:hypothetical protein
MRPVLIMTIAALAVTSACGSSGGHPASSPAAARAHSPAAAVALPTVKAGAPGFSGPVDPARAGQAEHVYGRCLRSWYAKTGSGTRVHVEYPGPANVIVDLTITDESEPPPEAHQQFTMAAGRQANDLRFPAIPHAGYPQITVMTGQRTLVCDAPAH